jgi:SAM-dependent methyltransferase
VFAVRPQRGRIHRVVHESASSGYRKQAVAYHQARPSYHPRMVERFADRYGQGLVVDLGAGTGIFTAQIVAAGVTVIAVEPVGEMRSVLEASLRGVEVRAGTAEALPVGSAGADTVVAAQAFHWFASDQALDEIHRVVRPGGHLVTVWNVWDETVEWVSEYNLILGRYEGDTPRHRTMEWRRAIEADDRFELVDDWAVENLQEMNVEGVVRRALSTSFIAALSAEEQAHVATQVRQLVEPVGPELAFPYRSELQAWRRP